MIIIITIHISLSIFKIFTTIHKNNIMKLASIKLRMFLLPAVAATILLLSCNGGGTSNSSTSRDSTSGSDDNTLLGAGSTFVYPLFSKLFSEYNKAYGLKVNYQSIG